jgi:hypothetical protein
LARISPSWELVSSFFSILTFRLRTVQVAMRKHEPTKISGRSREGRCVLIKRRRPMFNIKNAALALIAASTVATAVPAVAATASHGPSAVVATQWQGWDDDRWDDRRDWRDGRRDNRRDWRNDRRDWRGDRASWRGNDGRDYCRRSDGTTGLLVGGAAGALLGREVAGRRGDRTLGAVLGAAGGALLGREVDRGGSRCR